MPKRAQMSLMANILSIAASSLNQRCKTFHKILAPLLGFALSLPVLANAAQSDAKLTRVKDVLNLTADQAKEARAVQIGGVVTGFDARSNAAFVQDETAGIRLQIPADREDFRAGDRVEVVGVTAPGAFAPAVVPHRITVQGRMSFPVPLRVPWLQIGTGQKDGQWVEVTGIVRSVTAKDDGTTVVLASGDERIKAKIPESQTALLGDHLIDSRVRIQGVCNALFSASQEFAGAVISVPDVKLLTVEEPAPAGKFDVPATKIRDVLKYRSGDIAEHRVRIHGVVELFRPGISLFMTDGDGNLYVETASEKSLRPGDVIDVLGFPDFYQGGPALLDAEYRVVGSGPSPTPEPVKPGELLAPRHDSGLISVEARLLQTGFVSGQKDLLFQAGSYMFQATLEARGIPLQMAALLPNSIMRVTGVCILLRESDGTPYGLKLRLRTPDDLQLIESPSWWTPRRVGLLAAFLATSVLVVLVWTVSLRRRVRSQTEIIRRRYEREAALEKRYQDLIENAHDVIWTLDMDGTLKSLNSAGERIFGYPREKILGRALNGLMPPESAAHFAKVLSMANREEGLPPQELEIIAKEGHTVFLEVSMRMMREQGESSRLEGIARDITERKQAEKERLALEEQLRQSQKMEAVGQLAGGIAHDFNNLLTVINGYSDFLLSELAPEDPIRTDIQHIKEAGDRAASLTSQLLAFSRRQIVQSVVLDINDVVAVSGKVLRRLISENIRLNVLPNAAGRLIKADPGQVQQIIMNLSINARDAMPDGGVLSIETANVDLDEGSARKLGGKHPGPYVMLAVTDTGIGMDADTRTRIFEPFFSTKGLGKGTGLGLSTVYGIIRQCGGIISVQSEKGKGTAFKVYFPGAGTAETKYGPAEEKSGPSNKETILLVEDEPSVRNLIARGLRQHGYVVLEAANGPEALQQAALSAGAIHLLLTDVVMPEMSGKTLAARLTSSFPGVKTLYISGYTNNALQPPGEPDSEVAFLQKPFTTDVLIRKVREVMQSNQPG